MKPQAIPHATSDREFVLERPFRAPAAKAAWDRLAELRAGA